MIEKHNERIASRAVRASAVTLIESPFPKKHYPKFSGVLLTTRHAMFPCYVIMYFTKENSTNCTQVIAGNYPYLKGDIYSIQRVDYNRKLAAKNHINALHGFAIITVSNFKRIVADFM